MDASEDGRRGPQRQWAAPQPIVPLLVFAVRHVRPAAVPALCSTKVLPQKGSVAIDRAQVTRDPLNIFPGESTS
ncbi:hypothetical protein FJU31_10950 [Stenotrophomonas cyclobalanopsidis]|uniref:Uncharacterized protein n=1 Tax=Stenotrophomonas cyclobalanopsidis TaxID=2771362 RepID=A0ABQ6T025_9GAMM|nr:hypothetical protein FJU31_10950 [Stenotrophomonas cyclobalanopsidis]